MRGGGGGHVSGQRARGAGRWSGGDVLLLNSRLTMCSDVNCPSVIVRKLKDGG